MVGRVPLSALNRKLLRDVWQMRSQALAIILVMAAGVAMFVAYLSNFDSLQQTVGTYYERQRLADVFVSLKRAPERVAAQLAEIPGVNVVDTRVMVAITLDIEGMSSPASGLLVSVPADGEPRLNKLVLRRGRWPEAGRWDEILASEAFCNAHRFGPGDSITAIINGRRRRLRIAGVALSPEHVYSIPPGEMIPDDKRYGIFWMERRALAAAHDMEGGFNQASFALSPETTPSAVIADVDRVLEPYGGLGAIPRSRQFSAWMLENELKQLQTFGLLVPLIFLSVAAFVLNVALGRALALQRSQIAALKALGYSNRELAWHYLKWAMAIALGGAALGVVAGAWLGSGMIELYNRYFRFPALNYHLAPSVIAGAGGVSIAAAALGARSAVARAVRVPPAEAMQPASPARYRRSILEHLGLIRRMRPTLRMVLRNLERQPGRSLASITGIALAGAVLFVGLSMIDAMNALIDTEFQVRMRQDATVTFREPRSAGAIPELKGLPGVMRVEAYRSVPVRLRAGHRERTLVLHGLPEENTLNRVVDERDHDHRLPAAGLLLSRRLAETLHLAPGDTVITEVLEGARPVANVTVADLIDDNMGLQAYVSMGALHRLMREGDVVSGAYLQVDEARLSDLHARLKAVPAVAGLALTEAMLTSFRNTMAENLNLQIGINVIFAAIITFGVVYNAARISLSERSRELASLRVLGFTRGEISMILLSELAIVTVLSAPMGTVVGFGLSHLIFASFASEVYRIPMVVRSNTIAWAWIVIAVAAAISGLVVRRRLDTLDLVAVLKTRE